jgi:ubiquinone/menaquinone biosynthesis C-methylase UbiE
MSQNNHDPYGRGQYDALTAGNVIRSRWHLNKLRLCYLTNPTKYDRVLDAGCGAGNLIAELAPHCRQVVGCDIHHARLTFGARRGNGSYLEADLQQLPFSKATFETIFCMEVLEHLEQRIIAQVLREFYRILKPQGQVLITTPNYRSLWVIIEFLAETLRLTPEMVGGEHVSKYHHRTLAEALTRAGFVVCRLGTFNHFSPFASIISERWAEQLYHWEIKAGRTGGNLLYALGKKG